MTLTLPWPPSVNSYWGFSGHRRFLTKKAKAFNARVRQLATAQPIVFGSKRLYVHLVLCVPDRKTRDIDNFVKATLDAMTHAGLYDDDSQIDRLLVERGPVVRKGCCLVTIAELTPTAVILRL